MENITVREALVDMLANHDYIDEGEVIPAHRTAIAWFAENNIDIDNLIVREDARAIVAICFQSNHI